MKKFTIYFLLLGLVILSNLQGVVGQNVNVAGALVGNGTYPDLGTAFVAINGGAQTGSNILVSIVGNTTEPVTATLNQNDWTTLSIMPAGGVARTITGAVGGPLVDFNGADRVLVDGLNAGGNSLTFSNTTVGATSTMRFINDARSLIVQNSTLFGSNTSTTSGTVFISTSAGGGGNDSIVFNTCLIDAAGANLPINGVLSIGTAGQENGSIVFSACNIPNYFNATAISAGIIAGANNTDWTISACRFYQAASRTYTAAITHRCIQITSGNNHSITGNTIGFATAAGTGAYTMQAPVSAARFIAIDLAVGLVTASSVQGNTITAIGITTTSGANTANGVMCGINMTAGNVNVGTVAPNTIGGAAGIDLMVAAPTTTQGMVVGINSSSTGTIVIQNNIIGGLTSGNPVTATVGGGTAGINVSGAATSMTITGNTIGNATANNMRAGVLGFTTGSSIASGINLPSTSTNVSISGNTIQNFSSYGTGTAGYVRGIWTASGIGSAASYSIVNNTISNFVSNTGLTTIANGQAGALGINLGIGSNGVINNNTITNIGLSGVAATQSFAAGITCANGTNTTVSNNKISGITNAGTSVTVTAPSQATGIIIRSGTTGINVFNNMISLGTGQATNTAFIGIQGNHGSTPDPIDRIYHNTINITGVVGAGAQPSFGFYRGDFSVTARTPTVDVRNNLITNDRTGGTGFHFAIANNYGATVSATGWAANASNNNVLNSTAATIGWWGANQTFAGWQTASAGDAASYSGITVTYVNPANDLHLNMGITPTYIESDGQTIAMVPLDIDLQNRPGPAGSVNGGASMPDIGADEIDAVPIVCVAANGGAIAPTSFTLCENQTQVLTSTGATNGFGITYQWMVSSTAGGPYINVSGGSGATTTSYTTGPLVAGTWFYVLQTTCSAGPLTGLSNEVTITVNPAPTISVTPTTGSFCLPAVNTPITATASGSSSTYAWLPAAGLSTTVGPVTDALPLSTTTYTVTGTDGIGCTATATVAITVSEVPTISSISATPSSVCSGGSSALNVNAGLTTQYTVVSTAYNFETPGGAPTTVFAPTSDDLMSASINLPFGFFYFGQSYGNIFVGTNGFVQLGASSGSTAAYGAVIPNAAAPNNIIAGVWDDLNVTGAGAPLVRYFTNGVAPNRVFIVEWAAVKFYNGAANNGNVTFQIKMFENGVIEVHHNNVVDPAPSNHFCGIENSTGTVGYAPPGRNPFTTDITVSEAWAFVPSGPTVTYNWTPATFLSATNIANPNATGVTATTTYTVTVTNAGCSNTASTTITAGTALSSSASATPSGIACIGDNVTLNANPIGGGGPYSFAWTGPNSFSSTSQNPVITGITLLDAGTYSVTITDACAANSNATVGVTVNPLPVVAVSPTSASYCTPGPAITLTGSGASTYSWGPAAGLSATTGTSVDASPAALTTYTVTGTDVNGCIATATTIINSGANPTAIATATPSTICSGTNANLIVTASLPAPTYCQPVYTNGTGFGDFISNVTLNTINNTTAGAPSPYYTLFPAAGSTTTTLVAGNSYSIILTAGTYTINDVAAWIDYNQNGTLNDGIEKLGETDNLGAMPANTTFIFTVPLTAYNGTTRLRVRDVDHATTNDMDPCAAQSTYGETEDYIITIVGGVDQFTYSWSPSTFLSSTTNDTVTAVAATATTPYTVTTTSLVGCTVNANVTLTVNPLPIVNYTASPNDTICNGTPLTLSGTGATSYTWTGGVIDAVAFTPAISGSYTVTGTDGNGCTNTASAAIVVNTSPTVSYTALPNDTVCAGSNVTLSGTGASSYTWTGGITDAVAFTPAGSLTYTVTGTAANGCTNSASAAIVVNALPTVSYTASPNDTVCTGNSLSLSGTGAVSYSWTGGITNGVSFTPAVSAPYTVTGTDINGCTNTAVAPVGVVSVPTVSYTVSPNDTVCSGSSVTLSGTGAASYTWTGGITDAVAFTPAGTLTYTVTGTNGGGCNNTATATITVNTTPTVSYTVSPNDTVCSGTSLTLSGTGASSYSWTGGITDAVSFTAASSLTYTVTGTAANGCTNTASAPIVVNTSPTVSYTVSPNDTVCPSTAVTLSGTGAASYTWTGGIFNATAFTPAGSLTYTVTGTAANGCTNTASAPIVVGTVPSVNLGADVIQPAPPAVLDAGSGFTSYLWSTSEVTQTISVNTNGQYIVTVTNIFGCTDSDTINVNFTNGIINQNGTATLISLYPNPTSNGVFSVSIENIETSNLVLDILDMTGRVVYNRAIGSVSGNHIEPFSLTDLRMGTYVMRVTANGNSTQLRFIINK